MGHLITDDAYTFKINTAFMCGGNEFEPLTRFTREVEIWIKKKTDESGTYLIPPP